MTGSVPFSWFGGLINVQGVLCLEGDELILSFRKVGGWSRFWRSQPSQIHILLRHVDALEFLNSSYLFHVRLRLGWCRMASLVVDELLRVVLRHV